MGNTALDEAGVNESVKAVTDRQHPVYMLSRRRTNVRKEATTAIR